MVVNILNKFDKYGFALKSVRRTFYEQWLEPCIEIKYVTNSKSKNINSYGYPFKDFRYALKTKNDKEIVKEIYEDIKDMDIIESTKYLLERFPENANEIYQELPSYILTKPNFYEYLTDYIANLPAEKQKIVSNTLKLRIQGIDTYISKLESKNNQIL